MFSRYSLVAAAVFAAACQPAVQTTPGSSTRSPAPSSSDNAAPTMPMTSATATLNDGAGARVGTVTLTDSYAGVILTGNLTGLGLGAHAIHLHAVGKCVAPFTSAGGHFNPEQHQHGYLNPRGSHLGDLPNIDTPAAGSLRFEFLVPNVTLTGRNRLLDDDGTAIVVHAAKDDYTTDPAGNAGGRIACGVVQAR